MSNKVEAIKNDIVSNYPDSRYAEIILNPQSELSKDENSPEVIYTNLYKKFENEEYAEVITESNIQIKRLEGDDFLPKFEILKASAKGRLYGFEEYKTGIDYIALTYPNTEEGKKAQELLQNAIPVLAKKEFTEDVSQDVDTVEDKSPETSIMKMLNSSETHPNTNSIDAGKHIRRC